MSSENLETYQVPAGLGVLTPQTDAVPDFRSISVEGLRTLGALPEEFTYEPIDLDPSFGPVSLAERGHCSAMGLTVEAGGCNAAILVGEGVAFIDVCRYSKDDPDQVVERRRLVEKSDENNAFFGFIPDMKPGDLYGIRAYGPWDPNNKTIPNPYKLVLDPYAKAIVGNFTAVDSAGFMLPHVNEEVSWDRYYVGGMNTQDSAPYMPRSVVVDTDSYDWQGDRKPNTPKEHVITYEAHIKGMTMTHPDVPEHLRGTYAGMASPPIIEHLRNLGITTVELMPVQQFVTDTPIQRRGLKNYWGYQTLGFFAPHGEYSSAGQHGEQVNEFKDMVKAFHAAGIEVMMDVVYNHTPEGNEHGPTLGPKALFNKEFYLRDGYGHCNDDSGCGNTVNASSGIGKQLIMDSLRYWATEMHVDAFRFDLAPVTARVAPSGRVDMNSPFMQALATDPELKNAKIYAEPWDVREVRLGHFPENWTGEWSNKYRDVLREFFCRHGGVGEFPILQAGGYLPNQNRPVHFVAVHDGFPVQDIVTYDYKHNHANGEGNADGESNNRSYNFGHEGPTDDPKINALRSRAVRAMLTAPLVSPGTPLISHGDELGRTQGGNNNAYCHDDETTWISWQLTDEQKALSGYVGALTAFRKQHAVFDRLVGEYEHAAYRHNGERLSPRTLADQGGQKIFGLLLEGETQYEGARRDDSLMVIPNGTYHSLPFRLPDGQWEVVVNSATAEVVTNDSDGVTVAEGEVAVPGLAMMVLRKAKERRAGS